ncbi:MAG: phosphatase PAP2 family protein [Lentisphaeraceae bacterium]|nr:phosphatase PAP2 family protein [Lentisphaeraceae bacterium]
MNLQKYEFPLREFIFSSVIFAILFTVFRHSSLDLLISNYAFSQTSFESCTVLTTFALVGKYLSVVFAVYLLFVVLSKKASKFFNKKEAIFCILVLAVGPGFLNNFVLKPFFQRPRPVAIQQYNKASEKTFVKALSRGADSADKSFPSGHAGAAFFLLAPWFIRRVRERFAWKAFTLAFLWGGAVSVVRILEGRHFFSDCLASLFVVYFTSFFLSYLLRLHKLS